MTTMTHDSARGVLGSRTASGLLLALVSAVAFGVSGAVGRGLLDTGWSAGAVTVLRVGIGAAVVLPLGLRALRGRWHLLHRGGGLVVAYGVLGVAAAQFCYFSAIGHMQVAPALMIEYTGPAAVVLWLWLRHGERPSSLTLAGAVLAGLGLLLVLDLVSGADVSLVGTLWALGAMVGLASYFVISADEDNGIPPLALAAGGLAVGTVLLGLLGLLGVLPMAVSTAPATYSVGRVPWWVAVLGLGLVSAALSYVSGILASRRLGSRLASFVGLTEVLAAVLAAWLLLAELPGAAQLLGGGLVLAGVVVVKLGENRVRAAGPAVAATDPPG